jgi:hypothetical protein
MMVIKNSTNEIAKTNHFSPLQSPLKYRKNSYRDDGVKTNELRADCQVGHFGFGIPEYIPRTKAL